MRVEEVDLPGVGRKFTIRTQSGDEIVIVVHHNGRRQMQYYEGGTGDEPTVALDLTDEEAREAADMVLKDDAFATIVVAVEQGRIIPLRTTIGRSAHPD